MEFQWLENDWRVRLASLPIDPVMRFADEGLVLGFGTVLSPTGASARDISIDASEPRLAALLAAAHLRLATSPELAHVQKAAERWREGSDSLAMIHLALSGLHRLDHPIIDARRLFLADRLMGEGFHSETIIKGLDLASWNRELSKYSPDQPRVPAGSGRSSGEWTTGPTPPRVPGVGAAGSGRGEVQQSHGAPTFNVDLPTAIVGAATSPVLGPFGEAVKAVADAAEVAGSVSKWRELGPKGEMAIWTAVQARGWTLLGTQVYVRTALGLRVEDVMVHVPAGTAGNATGYDGFIEVKVNGGRYSPLQQAKDAIIGTSGGVLVTPVPGYRVGSNIVLETGLASLTITYEPE